MTSMTPERWQQIEALLDAALDLPADKRAAFIAGASVDAELRAEVERLVAACEAPDLVPAESAAIFAADLVARTAGEGADRAAGAGGRRARMPERIGRYRLIREAGQGGMGTVYVAERDDGQFRMRVALKLVRRGLHLDDVFVRRLVEERRILARLEHPNIARLLDGGVTDDALPYYVMEYVEGEPIDRYCDENRLSVERRLDLFCRVCRGVAYAHRNKVVHRDLKPSNILVTRDGEPKLLDFGIAKLLHDAVAFTGEMPVPTLTRTGQRLLTPEYASPEQIRGETVTGASDVYALGVLLYELLTGRRPYRHTGRTAHDVERAILEDEPTRPSTAVTREWSGQRLGADSTPARIGEARCLTPERLCRRLRGDLDAIVLTALRKEPERRYRSADDFAADVRRHLDGLPVAARGDGAAYRVRKAIRRHRVHLAVAASVAVATVLVGSFLDRNRSAREVVPGPTRRVAFDAALELDPAISPDGQRVAYAADPGGAMRLYVKPLGAGHAVPISDAIPGYHRAPRWSPDGTQVAFQSLGSIYVVPAAGGSPRLAIRPDSGAEWVAYPAWSPDGRELAYVQDWSVVVRRTGGGPARHIARTSAGPHSLAWSPDGKWIAFVSGNAAFVYGGRPWGTSLNIGNTAPSSVWVVPAAGGPMVRVTDERSLNTSPAWLPGRRGLLFVSNRDGDRDVYRVDLDKGGRPTGEPVRVTAGLGAHTLSLSGDGRRLAYSVFRNSSNIWSLDVPARGTASPDHARPVTSGSQAIEGVALSPDGNWLAFDSDRDGNQDVYKIAASGGEPLQLTSDSADDFMGSWSPNAREIAFYSIHDGRRRVQVMPAAGGVPQPVAARPVSQRFPGWSPDGRSLVFSSNENSSVREELFVVSRRPDGGWGPARRLTHDGGESGRWSPDGREIAYTRRDGIWATSPNGRAVRPVMRVDPAVQPVPNVIQWSPDGRTIYYKAFDVDGRSSIWSVPAAGCPQGARPDGTQPSCAPRLLVRFDDPRQQSSRPEFATDGRRVYFTLSQRDSDIWTMELSSAR